MIFITPVAGLCNRMRALDSALALARDADVAVKVNWILNRDLNCPFEELFEPIPGIMEVENQEERASGPEVGASRLRSAAKTLKPLVMLVRGARRLRRGIRNMSPNSRVIRRPEIKRLVNRPNELLELAKSCDLYIKTYDRFYRGARDYLGFRPIEAIRKDVDSFRLDGRDSIGVHIRCVHWDASWLSPSTDFMASMRRAQEEHPGAVFFLASDSEEVERRLEEEFAGQVVRQARKVYARDSAEGIRHALTDLYSLSSCKHLIGTFGSSFSETAGELGGMTIEFVRHGS